MRKNQHGNDIHNTYNIGHDTAKNRLMDKLNSNGYDIYAIRHAVVNHPTIKHLISLSVVKVSKIVGNNFTVASIDDLFCKYQKTKSNNVTIISVVNNILNGIMQQFNFSGYGKTQYWKTLDKKYRYNKRIYIGADIVTLNFITDNYSQKEFTCKLSDRKKITKYQG